MAIALDASTPAAVTSSGASTTTAAFTPPNASLLLACISADANNGSTDETVAVSDSASGSWNQAILQNANGGAVSAIFWRLCATSPGSMTVSCTDNKGAVAKRLRVQVWTGTDQTSPIGATAQSTATTVSYTSTVDQSQGVSCGLTANAVLTAGGTGNTLDDETGGFDSGDATFVLYRTALTTPAGSTVTLTIAGTSTFGHHVAVELVPPAAATNYAGPWAGPTPGRLGPTGQCAPQRLPAGTTYIQSLAGTLTSSGVATKATAAARAGTLTSSGALAKLDAKPLSGTLASAGIVAKQDQKPIGGTLASAGALAKQARKALVGAITPAGALSTIKVVLRSFAGALTPTGTVTRVALKGIGGTLATSGTLAKAARKALSGGFAAAGSLAKLVGRHLAGALAAAGALNVQQAGGTARATSSPTVAGRRTSTSAVTDRRTSTSVVADRRTSTPGVEG